MLTIRNGDKTLKVSRGAFMEVYRHTGWVEVSAEEPEVAQESFNGSLEDEDSKHTPGDSKPLSEPPTPSEDETLEAMSDTELKQYAALLGINTKSLTKREQLIKAIKASQKK